MPNDTPSSSNQSNSPPSIYTSRSSSDSPIENQSDSPIENQSDSYSSSSPSPAIHSLFLAAAVHLPTFRGLPGECPVSHLTNFNRLFPSNSASSLSVVSGNFPFSLLDDAALWYEISIQPKLSLSWDQTKSAFIRAFLPPNFREAARTEIFSLGQRDGESVNSYHLRMQWILKRWPDHGLPDSLVKGMFLDGLRDGLVSGWVSKPETLEEAVSIAMDCEGQGVRKGGDLRCGFCEGRHGEKDCEVRRMMKEEWMRRKKSGGEGKEEEKGEQRLDRVKSTGSVGRRSLCQCGKHQCWKKYEKSGSAVGLKPVKGDAAEAVANTIGIANAVPE